MRSRAILLVVGCVVVASCGAGDSTSETQPSTQAASSSTTTVPQTMPTTSVTTTAPPATASPGAGRGCEVLQDPGEYEGVGQFGEIDQPYWIVVPDAYADLAPAALYLHLATGGGSHQDMMDGWRPYLDDLEGLMVMVNTSGVGRGSSDALISLVDQIISDYCVDQRRVYVMGTGTSFGMTERLACDYPDRIAAFAASLGSAAGCTPTQSVPLLSFTGNGDRASVEALVARWASVNGCDSDPLVEDLGSGVHRNTYQNCDADVLFYDITTMQHAWPMHEVKGPGAAWVRQYDEVDYLEEAYKFFAEHPMP